MRPLAQFVGRIGCERLDDAAESVGSGVAMPAGVEVELRRQRRAERQPLMRTRHRLQSSVPVAVDVEVHRRKYVPKGAVAHVQADAESRRRLRKVRSMPDVVTAMGVHEAVAVGHALPGPIEKPRREAVHHARREALAAAPIQQREEWSRIARSEGAC